MELSKRLQELRKAQGWTQEELAGKLFVSRTAVSKWELGRGYPSIDSLIALSELFGVRVDELLSPGQALEMADKREKDIRRSFKTLIFALLDICALMLFVLPLFAERTGERIEEVSLFGLSGIADYLKIVYIALVGVQILWGITSLILQSEEIISFKAKARISFAVSALSAIVFTVSLQPYPATLAILAVFIKLIAYTKG